MSLITETTTGDLPISPLFGEIAMELGICQPSEIVDALCLQEQLRSFGLRTERLGQILVERGALTEAEVETVLGEMEDRTRILDIPGYGELEIARRDSTTLLFHGFCVEGGYPVSIVALRFAASLSSAARAEFEARRDRARLLRHENVIRVLDAGELEGIPFLVQERVAGPNLSEFIEEEGAVSAPRGLQLLRDAATGLEHSHSVGIVHGDLRPAAFRLPRDGGTKVGGFRIFEPGLGEGEARDRHLYASPEEIRDRNKHTVTADIYALGAVIYHALTGRPPFLGRIPEVTKQHLKRPAPDPRALVPGLTATVSDLLQRMLEKSPARRPASMDEVLSALETAPGPGDAAPFGSARGEPSRLLSRWR